MGSKEEFKNTGTTKREREVARLLNEKIRVNIVVGVRFANWSDSEGTRLFVSVDLVGGQSIPGGYVSDEMNAKQQAEAIYKNISTLARGL